MPLLANNEGLHGVSESKAPIRHIHNPNALWRGELNEIRIDRQPQQTVGAGFAAVLIDGGHQVSESQSRPWAFVIPDPLRGFHRDYHCFSFLVQLGEGQTHHRCRKFFNSGQLTGFRAFLGRGEQDAQALHSAHLPPSPHALCMAGDVTGTMAGPATMDFASPQKRSKHAEPHGPNHRIR